MTELTRPAPLWRRFAALIYDGLLLVGLALAGTLLLLLFLRLFGMQQAPVALQRAWMLCIGFGFFGWSWTHGGRTPGMLAWKLQVRREDGSPVRWPIALLRYVAAIASWISVIGVLWCLFDARRRALHDLAAGTEMVVASRGT